MEDLLDEDIERDPNFAAHSGNIITKTGDTRLYAWHTYRDTGPPPDHVRYLLGLLKADGVRDDDHAVIDMQRFLSK